MPAVPQTQSLWAQTRLSVHDEDLVLVSLPLSTLADAATLVAAVESRFGALLLEPGGVSLTLPEKLWSAHRARFTAARELGPYVAITFDLEVDPSAVGYFAPAALRLAEAGIGGVPQCGYLRDHILVRRSDLERAVDVLREMISEAGGASK